MIKTSGPFYIQTDLTKIDTASFPTGTQFASLADDVENVESELADTIEDVGNLTTTVGNLETTVGGFDSRITTVEGTVSTLNTTVGGLQTTVGSLQTTVGTNSSDILNIRNVTDKLTYVGGSLTTDKAGIYSDGVLYSDYEYLGNYYRWKSDAPFHYVTTNGDYIIKLLHIGAGWKNQVFDGVMKIVENDSTVKLYAGDHMVISAISHEDKFNFTGTLYRNETAAFSPRIGTYTYGGIVFLAIAFSGRYLRKIWFEGVSNQGMPVAGPIDAGGIFSELSWGMEYQWSAGSGSMFLAINGNITASNLSSSNATDLETLTEKTQNMSATVGNTEFSGTINGYNVIASPTSPSLPRFLTCGTDGVCEMPSILDWHLASEDGLDFLSRTSLISNGDLYHSKAITATNITATNSSDISTVLNRTQHFNYATVAGTFYNNKFVAENITFDNDVRLGGVESNLDFLAEKTSNITKTGFDSHFSGNVTASNITSTNSTDVSTALNRTLYLSTETGKSIFTGNLGIGNSPNCVFDIGGSTTINAGISLFSGFTDNTNAIRSVQFRNLSNGTNAEMRFIACANDNNYVAFTSPSNTNTSTGFFNVPKSSGNFIFSSGGLRDLYMGPLTSNKLVLGTNNQRRLTIASDGKIGILNDSPSEALDVTGNIIASGTVGGTNITTLTTKTQNLSSASMDESTFNNKVIFSGKPTVGMNNNNGDKRIIINSDANANTSAIELHAGKLSGTRICYLDFATTDDIDNDFRIILNSTSNNISFQRPVSGSHVTGVNFDRLNVAVTSGNLSVTGNISNTGGTLTQTLSNSTGGYSVINFVVNNTAAATSTNRVVSLQRWASAYWSGVNTPFNWTVCHETVSRALIFSMNDGAFVAYINPSGTSGALNTTIEHLTISSNDLVVGDVVEMTGDIINNIILENGELDFIINPEDEIAPNDCCPVIKKCITRTKKYCGVVVQVINEGEEIEVGDTMKRKLKLARKCYRFASHGDCLVKVLDSSIYSVGDTLLSDLSVLGDDETITNLKISCTIGKISRIMNGEYIAVFKN